MGRFNYLRRIIFDGRGRPPFPKARPKPATWSDDQITGSCLGHSTVLMNFFGCWVLTDPVFSERVGPGVPPFILGPKRYLQPALRPHEFPRPDLLLISHAHFDHFDTWSLLRFPWKTPILTAPHTAGLLRRRGFRDVHELAWGESLTLTNRAGTITISAIEVAHWGARTLRDHHRGYNGYVIERKGRAVCFAGDTAYTTRFADLRNRPNPIDLMLMPVGAYNPWIRAHCDPEQAIAMTNMAGAATFVPIHHQTFKLSNEPMDEPAKRIRAAFRGAPDRLLAVEVGETFQIPLGVADRRPSIPLTSWP